MSRRRRSGPDLEGPVVVRPLFVRVLTVLVWVLLAVLVVLSLLEDVRGGWRVLPGAVLLAAAAYALFWAPCVRVDDDGVTLVNVVRRVRVPFSALDAVGTRFSLSLESSGRRWSAWAAPAPGRTSAMGLSRGDAAGIRHLGVDPEQGVSASAAPNTESGGAALLVQHRLDRWRATTLPGGADAGHGVEVSWNVPLTVLLLASGAATALTLL